MMLIDQWFYCPLCINSQVSTQSASFESYFTEVKMVIHYNSVHNVAFRRGICHRGVGSDDPVQCFVLENSTPLGELLKTAEAVISAIDTKMMRIRNHGSASVTQNMADLMVELGRRLAYHGEEGVTLSQIPLAGKHIILLSINKIPLFIISSSINILNII